MARYTGPKTRIARKFGEAIFGPDKVLKKELSSRTARKCPQEKNFRVRNPAS